MIIHYTFLVMDGVAILEGGYQYIPLDVYKRQG